MLFIFDLVEHLQKLSACRKIEVMLSATACAYDISQNLPSFISAKVNLPVFLQFFPQFSDSSFMSFFSGADEIVM